ncbi:MAG: hypothetical protein LBC85_07995 [Fibromonadaceae bacterium]|jgi:hypothetical protein|nr:hypothetical protein [Fibromonadaceae bacterium]
MGKKSVYIETTIPSLVTAKPSTDISNLFRQTQASLLEPDTFMRRMKLEETINE